MTREKNDRPEAEHAEVRARFRSACLGWTDPESGDRLTVRVDGAEELVPELVAQGFELLPCEESEAVATDGNRHTEAVVHRLPLPESEALHWRSLYFRLGSRTPA